MKTRSVFEHRKHGKQAVSLSDRRDGLVACAEAGAAKVLPNYGMRGLNAGQLASLNGMNSEDRHRFLEKLRRKRQKDNSKSRERNLLANTAYSVLARRRVLRELRMAKLATGLPAASLLPRCLQARAELEKLPEGVWKALDWKLEQETSLAEMNKKQYRKPKSKPGKPGKTKLRPATVVAKAGGTIYATNGPKGGCAEYVPATFYPTAKETSGQYWDERQYEVVDMYHNTVGGTLGKKRTYKTLVRKQDAKFVD